LDFEAINATAFSELAKRQAEARAAETRHLHEILAEHDAAEAAPQAAAVRMFEEAEAKRQEKATILAQAQAQAQAHKLFQLHSSLSFTALPLVNSRQFLALSGPGLGTRGWAQARLAGSPLPVSGVCAVRVWGPADVA
jgi:hypothetical protein